jgi:hypothetical protein
VSFLIHLISVLLHPQPRLPAYYQVIQYVLEFCLFSTIPSHGCGKPSVVLAVRGHDFNAGFLYDGALVRCSRVEGGRGDYGPYGWSKQRAKLRGVGPYACFFQCYYRTKMQLFPFSAMKSELLGVRGPAARCCKPPDER